MSEVRSDEHHEDIVDEQHDHQYSHKPRLQEPQARQQHRDEGKPQDVLEDPSVTRVTLGHPPRDHTHTEQDGEEEQDVWLVAQNGELVPWNSGIRVKE